MKLGVAVTLILVSSMARADETLSEILSRNWSINMNKVRAWPLYWNGDSVCLLNGSGETSEQPLKHLSNADLAYLRPLKVSLPSKTAFDLRVAINDVTMAIARYSSLLQAAQSNHVEGTVVTDGSIVALFPRRPWHGGTNTHNKGFTNTTTTADDGRRHDGRERAYREEFLTHQQSTTVVNVEEVKRLKRVLKDLEDKKKALLLLGKMNPLLLSDAGAGPHAGRKDDPQIGRGDDGQAPNTEQRLRALEQALNAASNQLRQANSREGKKVEAPLDQRVKEVR